MATISVIVQRPPQGDVEWIDLDTVPAEISSFGLKAWDIERVREAIGGNAEIIGMAIQP